MKKVVGPPATVAVAGFVVEAGLVAMLVALVVVVIVVVVVVVLVK